MKSLLVKFLVIVSVLSAGLVSCSKEIKKDNSAEHDATRKAAQESTKELDKE